MAATESARRDWLWENDGELDGMYVETRPVTIKNGPSAGTTKLVFDFHVGLQEESVTVWQTSVIRSKFAEELKRRKAADFEAGERIRIKPCGWKDGPNGKYRDFDVWFEHAAPKPTAAELLNAKATADVAEKQEPADSQPDDDIPF